MVLLDCGRKYFTVDWIKALITEMAEAGYTHLQLAFGNNGMRFLLDNMSVTVGGTTYSSVDVTAAIKEGNLAYNNKISADSGIAYNPDVNELTQADMDAIIAHAKNKGIGIVPLLNNPGHMNAIVSAITSLTGEDASYNKSVSTIDLADEDAVQFSQALVKKYIDYFAANGSVAFNLGADEYANDAGNGQFSNLIYYGYYDDFINYLNTLATYVVDKDMVPMTFNDGIYYNQNTSNGTINENIVVCYWSDGWSGYNLASASFLNGKNLQLINTHGNYYFVLHADRIQNPTDTALNFDETSFIDDSKIDNPAGAMFCIWCDIPGKATEQEVASLARMTLRKMGAAMNGTTTYSQEEIPGGFKADGAIAETREWKVVPAGTNTNIEVGGYELTHAVAVEVFSEELPKVERAENVLAWDITPYVGDTQYSEKGTVSFPVPESWNTERMTGFYIESGNIVLVEGQYADGYYKFNMPHFSVAGIAELSYDELIELAVGEEKTVTIDGVDLTGQNYTPDPAGIATVAVQGQSAVADTTVSNTPVTQLEAGTTYIIKCANTNYALTSDKGGTTWGNSDGDSRAFKYFNGAAEENMWTVEKSGDGYKLKCAAGYLNLGLNAAWLNDSGETFTVVGSGSELNLEDSDKYGIDALGGLDNYRCAGGWIGTGTRLNFFKVTEATEASTEITFTGDNAGETFVVINGTIYKIVVVDNVEITIDYVDINGNLIKRDTVQVAYNATTYALADFNVGDKLYIIADKTLNIKPAEVQSYEVIVTETTEDLTQVEGIEIEYWQTNARVTTAQGNKSVSISAQDAYSEGGIELRNKIALNAHNGADEVIYWRSRLLLRAENEQTEANGSDKTLEGIGFTKVRYWNGEWAVYTENNQWQSVAELGDYQMVAYYMNDMKLADEVGVGTSDWGRKADGNMADKYLGINHVSIAFQVVYEGGSTSPASTTAEDLAPYTYLVDNWGTRGIGSIAIRQIGDYKIWKVTAETGEHATTSNGWDSNTGVKNLRIIQFEWDGNEKTVWEGEPVAHYTMINDASHPKTSTDEGYEEYYDNLKWDENDESILIRIYVKAEEVDPEEQEKDTLKVVYYDERFDRELTSFNYIVKKGITFEHLDPKYTSFNGPVAGRIDVTGCRIENALGKEQIIQTNLTNLEINVEGKYQKDLYTYNGSELADDEKTLYLYYTLKTIAPSYVVDFGLPIEFELTDIVDENYVKLIDSVEVQEDTGFGRITYDSEEKKFTYTPTEILQSVNELPISIKFKDETKATVINAGVYPATTVYYEESFLKWDEKDWTLVTDATKTLLQECEKLDEHTYNFGYDDVYEENIGASNGTSRRSATIGATGEFDFTGTGIQVFANCTEGSGYVAVQVKDSNGKLVKLAMVDTVVDGGETSATNGQTGNMYGLPIVSLIDLQNMPHGTYNVKVIKIMDTEPVSIDGIRVFNTIADSTIFEDDLEDNPEFYELRDYVLHAINVTDSEKYGTLAEMAKQVYAGISDDTEAPSAIITDKNIENVYGSGATAQDLLDNGPKNELYLYKDQTLTFKVKTDRIMQLGLKTPKGETKYKINVTSGDETINTIGTDANPKSIASSVDMFYSLGNKRGEQKEYTIEVTNKGKEATSNDILSITLLKICDDPNAGFVSLTEKDMEHTLATMGYTFPEEENKVPESTVKPEDTTKPESTTKPGSSTTTEGTKFEAEDTKDSSSFSLPTEIVKVEVADSTKEPSKVDQKETVSASTDVKEETTESEETVVESEITVEEDVELETETDIQESEISETTESEESNGNLIVMIGSAAAILAAVIALIFGFKKSKKR